MIPLKKPEMQDAKFSWNEAYLGMSHRLENRSNAADEVFQRNQL
jgi:hypothetical protein